MWKEINEFVVGWLADLKKVLPWKHWLFTIAMVPLSVLMVICLLVCWGMCLVVLFGVGVMACACIPFSVIYNCIKEWKK